MFVTYVRTHFNRYVRTLFRTLGVCASVAGREKGAHRARARARPYVGTRPLWRVCSSSGFPRLRFPCVRAYARTPSSVGRFFGSCYVESYARMCVRTCAHLVSPPSPQRRARHGRFHHRQLPRRDEELPRSSEDQWREQCTKECRKLTQFFSRGFNHEFEHLSEAIDYVKNEIHEWGWHNASNQAMVRDLGQKFQKRFESPGDISSRLPGGAITRTGPKSRSSGTSSK